MDFQAPDEAVEVADPEPKPGDGPDYHAEHAAWESRQAKDAIK